MINRTFGIDKYLKVTVHRIFMSFQIIVGIELKPLDVRAVKA